MLKIGNSYTKMFAADNQTIKKIAEILGDRNPIHLGETYAGQSKWGYHKDRYLMHGIGHVA